MANLDPPVSLADDKIVRWHPEFVLENVAEVEEAPLPQPPSLQICSSAKDVLDIAQCSVMPVRVQQALENVAAVSEASKQPVETTLSNNPTLKWISQSLIDRVKYPNEYC